MTLSEYAESLKNQKIAVIGIGVSNLPLIELLLRGGCDVTACKFNTIDCRCSAARISVQNELASSKSETLCSTFCPRGSC